MNGQMGKNYLVLSLGAILLLILFVISDFSEQARPSTNVNLPVLANDKAFPNEAYYIQRAFPEATPNVEGYEKAMQQLRAQALLRGGPNGFDRSWTSQGPGNIGARINTVAVHPHNKQIIYVGFSAGGVFKTSDGGLNWTPIFDQQTYLAIGDIALDPRNPDIVYVGTGDPNISGFPFIGDGLYRSKDGGKTWESLGLEQQRIISKIAIHPGNSNIIYVACMGLPFERNRDRGVYKSTDGGQSWQQVLFLSEETGVIDMLLNPQNPQELYAAGWDRIRNNKESLVSGYGAKIHKSEDGGASWKVLGNGLPEGPHTRIGLAQSESNPDVVYALYVDMISENGCSGYNLSGIYKSTNAGMSWDAINTSAEAGLPCNALGGFGWYFGKIRVNPFYEDDIFVLGVELWRSSDSGLHWAKETPNWWDYDVHADKHDLIFIDPGSVLLATDGGLYKGHLNTDEFLANGDASDGEWIDIENIASTQFYRVGYNPHQPNLYYGGAQDNGTTAGNAAMVNQWLRIYGGDGFEPVFHPDNPDIFYVEQQNGNIYMTLDGGIRFQKAVAGISGSDPKNWNSPYIMSAHDPRVLYIGTDKIYRSESDSLPNWVAISEPLTQENDFKDHNISSLSESPINAAILYAGSSDAQLWRSIDGATSWKNIGGQLPYRYISSVKASPYYERTVYVTHSGYKDNDFTPHLHRSTDAGATWENITSDLPPIAINDILVLPEREDTVLFVATDGGVYASLNEGLNWNRLGNNMPYIAVNDLVWNEAFNELVAATFARGIMSFPLDSIDLDNSVLAVETINVGTKPPLNLSPNPASTGFWLNFENIEVEQNITVVLLDMNGRLVYKREGIRGERIKEYFSVENLPRGTYLVQLKLRHEIYSGKLILQ